MDPASSLWTEWFEQHGPALLLYARQWTSPQAEAEDIVQEAFVRFWTHRAQVDDPAAYLYRCVRNVAQDWRRRTARHLRHTMPPAGQGQSAGSGHPPRQEPWFEPVEASLIQEESARQVQQALSALPEEQREVVVLKIWAGLSFSAIGQVMGTSPHTAASRYRYALKALQTQLERGFPEGSPNLRGCQAPRRT